MSLPLLLIALTLIASGALGAEPMDWRLVDVALIGADPAAPAFATVTDVAFSERGEVMVLDGSTAEVVVFELSDSGGAGPGVLDTAKLIRRIGRKGQGPGELDAPTHVSVAPGGELFVFDPRANNRVSRFTPDGTFIDSTSTPFPAMSGLIRTIGAGEAGTFMLYVPSRVVIGGLDPLRNPQLLLLEPGAEAPRVVYDWTDLEVEPMDLSNPSAGITMYTEPRPIWALLTGGLQAVGRSDRYEIRILDRNGEPVGTLRRDQQPQRVTDEVKEAFRAQLPRSLQDRDIRWGEYLPLISRIFAGPDGTVLVMRGNNGAPKVDVFSADQRFLVELDLPRGFLMMAARGGLLAGRVETEDMEAAVRVLRMER